MAEITQHDLSEMLKQCKEDPCDLDYDNSVVARLIERIAALTTERDDLAQNLSAAYEYLGDVNRSIHLHDHIFNLTAERDKLSAQVGRLSAPLTHAEWKQHFRFKWTDDQYSIDKENVSDLIAARAAKEPR